MLVAMALTSGVMLKKKGLVSAGLFDLFLDGCRECPERILLHFDGQKLSYGDVLDRCLFVADTLQRAGVQRGTRVGLYYPNHIHFLPLFLAITSLGACVVPINPLLKAEEIGHILSDAGADTLICHPEYLHRLLAHSASDNSFSEKRVESGHAEAAIPRLKNLVLVGEEKCDLGKLSFETLIQFGESELARPYAGELDLFERDEQDQQELALLVYTSGTTGKPKGAMLSVANILFAVRTYPLVLDTTEKDLFAAVLPLCHLYGLIVVLLGTIFKKAGMVIFEHFDAHRLLRAISELSISVLPAVPTMYHFLLLEREKHPLPLPALRLGMCGGASMPPELLARLERELGIPVQEGWALTESSVIATLNPLTKRKCGSIGPALPGIKVVVMDDAGKELPCGSGNVGELCISGPNIMGGYLNRPQATEEALKDGFLHTGDLGYMDEDGYLYIVGRSKEMIIRGGMNIYPREIENVLLRCEVVKDVAVIGIPDENMGERVKAFVVLKDGLKEEEHLSTRLKHFCSEHLADYKVPRVFAFVDSIPRNSTGKVLKRLLS